MNILNKSSIAKLSTVNIRMQVIVTAAATALENSNIFFIVTQGLRTKEEQAELYAQGRTKPGKIVTWTLNSNHLSGLAVDLAPLIDGKLNWDEDGKLGAWPVIATAMKNAAIDMGEIITWGGDWQGKKRDRPHFELSRTRA
jgi:peptidoglycan L-alanyl-D-glutamate endopeptidase CwlK